MKDRFFESQGQSPSVLKFERAVPSGIDAVQILEQRLLDTAIAIDEMSAALAAADSFGLSSDTSKNTAAEAAILVDCYRTAGLALQLVRLALRHDARGSLRDGLTWGIRAWAKLQAAQKTIMGNETDPDAAEMLRSLSDVGQQSGLALPPATADDGEPSLMGSPSIGLRKCLDRLEKWISHKMTKHHAGARRWPQEVLDVRMLLEGSRLLLIGAARDLRHEQMLERAFAIPVDWISTNEHESLTHYKPSILRTDIRVVLLAKRWSSHSFGELATFCQRFDKCFVRLPGGLNPVQVAHAIMHQCSQKLRRAA